VEIVIRLTRRTFLSVAALPLAACTTTSPPAPVSQPPTSPAPQRHEELFALERKFGARLGVYASGGGWTIEHRADERFAFCSTFKGLATAAVLHRDTPLDTVVAYS
jgi:beta-lactamase class A